MRPPQHGWRRLFTPVGAWVLAAALLTAVLAVWLTPAVNERSARGAESAELRGLVAARAASLAADLGRQVQVLLSVAAHGTTRQAAIADPTEPAALDAVVGEAARDSGLRSVWLVRPRDLRLLAGFGDGPAPPPTVIRALIERHGAAAGSGAVDAGVVLSAPSGPADGEVSVLAIAPVSIGSQVAGWLLGRLASRAAADLPAGEGDAAPRWWLDVAGAAELPEGLRAVSRPPAAPADTLTLSLDGAPVALAYRRVSIGRDPWVLAAAATVVGTGPTLAPQAWRVGFGAILIGLLCAALAVRARTVPASERAAAAIMETLQARALGDESARAAVQTVHDPGALAATLDAVLDERAALRESAVRTRHTVETLVSGLADSVASLAGSRDLGRRLADDDAVLSPLVVRLNEVLEAITAGAVEIRRDATLLAGAAHECEGEADAVDRALGTQRQVLAEALGEFDRLRGVLVERAAGAKQAHDALADWRALRGRGLAPLEQAGAALERASRMLRATEKRIKSFGERSQEIGEIVAIIVTIAERTRVAALNASLQAATAGADAGGQMGFSDEVRRLSDAARESADQIRRQADVIRRETAATGAAVNEALDETNDLRGLVATLRAHYGEALDEGEHALRDVDALDARATEALRLSDSLLARLRTIDEAAEDGSRALRRQHGQVQRLNEGVRSLLGRLAALRTPEAS